MRGFHNSIAIFISVYTKLNYRDAAKSQDVSLATISRTIKNLENDCGKLLFFKNNRGIEPTNDAHQLYKSVSPHLIHTESNYLEFCKEHDQFTFSCLDILSPIVMKTLSGEQSFEENKSVFRHEYEGESREELIDNLRFGSLDLAFDAKNYEQLSLVSKKVTDIKLDLVGSSKVYNEILFKKEGEQLVPIHNIGELLFVKSQWAGNSGVAVKLLTGVDYNDQVGATSFSHQMKMEIIKYSKFIGVALHDEQLPDFTILNDKPIEIPIYVTAAKAKLAKKKKLKLIFDNL
ncbi:TPA: LysR family transcriptional regulator [Vibrio vulnificus]|nr:LysR family transcriptional regulator [Vibrio vulnificus]